jgi:hypothetical protein
LQRFPDSRIALPGNRLLDEWQQRGLAGCFDRLCRNEPHGAIGRQQLERTDGSVKCAANPVGDDDAFEAFRCGLYRRHGCRIEDLVVPHDDHAPGGYDVDVAILHGLQQRERRFIAGCNQRVDGLEPGTDVLGTQPGDDLLVERARRNGAGEHCDECEDKQCWFQTRFP